MRRGIIAEEEHEDQEVRNPLCSLLVYVPPAPVFETSGHVARFAD